MSVKLLDNEAFYGYRVRRTVNGKLYQEYYSLKSGGKRLGPKLRKAVEQEAIARDDVLGEEQKRVKKQLKASRCFNANGTVKGISYLLKTEKSGTVTPIFQVGIASELESKIVCTSFSLNAHGKELAWEKAVEAYAKHKVIGKGSKLYKKLMDSMPKVKNVKKAAAPAKKKAAPVKKKAAPAKKKAAPVKKKAAAVKKKAAPAKKKAAPAKKKAAPAKKKAAPAKKKAAPAKKKAAPAKKKVAPAKKKAAPAKKKVVAAKKKAPAKKK